MDVIVPFQFGVQNLVATSGTALTIGQVRMLRKYAKVAVVLYDADQAGEAASLRGLDILIENDMRVRIATLPAGEDPDSFISKNGRAAFDKVIEKAKDLFEYKLDVLVKKLGEKDIPGIVDEMLPTIAKISKDVEKSMYLTKLAERLGIHEASLRHEMSKVKPDYSYNYGDESKIDNEHKNFRKSEIHLLGLSLLNKGALDKVYQELGIENIKDETVKSLFNLISKKYSSGEKEINIAKLVSLFDADDKAKNVIMEGVRKADITEDYDKAAMDCIMCIKKENKDEELKSLSKRLKQAEQKKNHEEVSDLIIKINNLHKEKVV